METMKTNLKYIKLIEDMKTCEQTKGMSVLEHGQLVNDYYKDLMNHLRIGSNLKYDWKVPDWVYKYKFTVLTNVHDDDIMNRYQIHHDCGKPYCLTIDADGKQHFPNHAEVSYNTWLAIDPYDEKVAELIRMDMDAHTLKSEDMDAFSKNHHAISLLVTALCEVHANASMFGGLESTSFKIKWKHLDKRGRQVLNLIPFVHEPRCQIN